MREDDIYVKLFGFGSNTTYYTWKKDPKRVVFKLLDKYFTNNELIEFINTGQIKRLEKTKYDLKFQKIIDIKLDDLYSKLKETGLQDTYISGAIRFFSNNTFEDIKSISNLRESFFGCMWDNVNTSDSLKPVNVHNFINLMNKMSDLELEYFLLKYDKWTVFVSKNSMDAFMDTLMAISERNKLLHTDNKEA